jgi:hypothetical protein
VDAAARVAVLAVAGALDGNPLPEEVILCAFSAKAAAALETALRDRPPGMPHE